MAMKLMGMKMYGMSELSKGYNVYMTNNLAGTFSELKGKTHEGNYSSVTLARKNGVRALKNGSYKYAVIYKGRNERAEGALFMDGPIPCWVNETHNYIVNANGSIRNGVRYR